MDRQVVAPLTQPAPKEASTATASPLTGSAALRSQAAVWLGAPASIAAVQHATGLSVAASAAVEELPHH